MFSGKKGREKVEMTDKNSFETVELLKPISLIQIDGSEPLYVKDEAETVQSSVKTNGVTADNAMTVSGTTDVNPKTDIKAKTEITPKTDVEASAEHDTQKVLVDPKKLLGNDEDSGERQDYQKHNYAARFIVFCVIVIGIIFTLVMVRNFKATDKHTVAESNYNPILVSQGEDTSRFIYTGGAGLNIVPVYTEMGFDADEIDADLPVIINHKCVEYTNSSNRILYFTATPTEEDVGLMMNVEMFDRFGHSFGASANSNCDVSAGEEFMIPIFFSLSPGVDLSGVTYKIKAETFKDREEALLRTITDVTEAEKGRFLITCEGATYSSVNIYVAMYKNGNVVCILSGYSDFDDNGKAVVEVYKGDVDYDTYKVFY